MRRIPIRRLTSEHLDARLRGARLYKISTKGWDRTVIGDGLAFDLSRCVEVDIAGVAQLLVILERASLDEIASTVTLPVSAVLRQEVAAWEEKERSGVNIMPTLRAELVGRHTARVHLDRLGFPRASRLAHLPKESRLVSIVDHRDDIPDFGELEQSLRSLLGALGSEQADPEGDEVFVPTELQLHWIDRLTRPELTSKVDELESVLSQGRQGLPAATARSIARTVVYEALDNVRVHAGGAGAALLGAAFTSDLAGRKLRIVLGDSGAGLVHTLRSYFHEGRHDKLLPLDVRSWDVAWKTAVWAFHPLSTSRPSTIGEPAIRGLSRVRHQLQFQRGSIRLRTGIIELFVTAPTDRLPLEYRAAERTLVPGTLLDVTLNSRRPLATGAAPDPFRSRLEIAPLFIDSTAPDVDEALSARVLQVPEDRAVCLIATGLDFTKDGGHASADHLARLVTIVGGRVLICLLPEVPSGLIYAVLGSLSEGSEHLEIVDDLVRQARPSMFPDDPVLVLGSDRRVTWWGPLEGRAGDLARLAAASGFAVPVAELEPPEDHKREDFVGASVALQRWVQGGHLVITSEELNRSLARWLDHLLRSRFDAGGEGVVAEDVLLPSLEPVGRAVDVAAMLTGLGVAGFAGQVAGHVTQGSLTTPISLLAALPDVPEAFVRSFALAAGYDGRRLVLDPTRDGWRLGGAPEHRTGGAVVLAGIAHRGETVRAVLEALMRWGVEPQLTVLILDARASTDAGLRALDRVVPVRSLTHVQLPPAQRDIKTLLMQEAEQSEGSALTYDISPSHLAEMMSGYGDGFRLVHVERSEERHLVGYYDFRTLLADDQLRGEIAKEATERIIELTPPQTGSPHQVFYPEGDENRAAVLAHDVATRLGADRAVPIARDAVAPGFGLFANGSPATFIDWGVVTARTARRALHELAQAGATHVNFVAIASQLDEETEIHLRGIAAIHGRRQAGSPGELSLDSPQPVVVPVAFRPLSRIAATAYSRATCPLCRVVSDFTTLAQQCPSSLLRNVIDEKVERLRARPRDEALGTSRDLYGTELSFSDRANLISLWSVIDRARSSLVDRDELRTLLQSTGASDFDLTAVSLCRILAVRHDLLHSPPLSDSAFRRLVVDAILPILTGAERTEHPPAVRRQAVVSLRAASKDRFVAELVNVLEANVRARAVVAEVLLATYSILARSYYQGSKLMDSLVTELERADEVVQQAYTERRTDPDVLQTVATLRRMATTLRARRETTDPQAAWAALRGTYRDDIREHHHAVNRLGQIDRQLNDLATQVALSSGDPDAILAELDRIADSWDVCADFLASSVLPYLAPLRDILLSRYYEERCGDVDVWSRWSSFLTTAVTEQDLAFGRVLTDLLRTPSEFDDAARARLLSEVRWMEAVFLGVHRPHIADRRQTLLYEWLSDCPVALSRLRDYLDSDLRDVDPEAKPVQLTRSSFDLLNESVFLSDDLLRAVASTLVNNVHKHGSIPDTDTTLSVSRDGGRIFARFCSIGTAHGDTALTRATGGIEGLRRRIAPFGCAVEPRIIGEDFETTIELPAWSFGIR